MSEPNESIERMAVYYQQFHHTCITWYITILGFFVAGVIAAPDPTQQTRFLWIPILITSSAIFGLFLYFILHYGARIKLLVAYAEGTQTPIPHDWRKSHKNVSIDLHGSGSIFFVSILLAMQVALISLLALRY